MRENAPREQPKKEQLVKSFPVKFIICFTVRCVGAAGK